MPPAPRLEARRLARGLQANSQLPLRMISVAPGILVPEEDEISTTNRLDRPGFGLLAAVALFALSRPAFALSAVDSLNPLYAALPVPRIEAVDGWERIRSAETPLSRVHGLFTGFSAGGESAGTVVHVSVPGYGGEIGLLVVFDPEGTLLRVKVVAHNETQCHVGGLVDGSFQRQFEGLRLSEKLRLLVGLKGEKAGDVDAMSGGTVTSRAIVDGVAEARVALFLARAAGLLG